MQVVLLLLKLTPAKVAGLSWPSERSLDRL